MDNWKDIEGLLERKKDLESKLQKLEDLKNQTKPKIYEKIRKEYMEKIKEISDSLSLYKDDLAKRIKELNSRLHELKQKMEDVEDYIEELKVRHDIGEFSDSEYQVQKEKSEQEREALKQEISGIEKDLSDLEEIVGNISMEEDIEKNEVPVTSDFTEDNMSSELDEENFIEEIIEEDLGSSLDDVLSEDLKSFDESANKVEENNINDINELTKSEEEDADIFSGDKLLEELEEETEAEDLLDELSKELENQSEGSKDMLEEFTKDLNEDTLKEGDDEDSKLFDELVNELGLEDLEGKEPDPSIIHEDNIKFDSDKEIEGIKCPKCGFVNKADAWICEKCGAELA